MAELRLEGERKCVFVLAMAVVVSGKLCLNGIVSPLLHSRNFCFSANLCTSLLLWRSTTCFSNPGVV